MLTNFAELTSPESGKRLPGAILLLPVGAVEPHGPHLPLETDTILSVETASRAARMLQKAGRAAFVAPAVPYSIADFSKGFPGRASVAREAMFIFLRSVLAALAASSPSRILLITLHFEPAHLDTLREAAAGAQKESGVKIQLVEFTKRRVAERIGGEFATGSCHAGDFETSLVLAARPSLVDANIQKSLTKNFVALPEKMRAGAATFAECGMVDAYCGDPASATAARGEEIYNILSSVVVETALA